MNQAITLEKYIMAFYRDYNNPAHSYLKMINGCEVGQPLKVYILAENANVVNANMAKDAAYLFVLDVNDTLWPQRAPRGWIETPNGMYTCGHNICTSNGTYHPESYVVVPFEAQILALYMAMCTNDKQLDHGISVVAYSKKRGPGIIAKSKESREWTFQNYGEIARAIDEKYAMYSTLWPILPQGSDPARWIIIKYGRGKGAAEKYIELDPAIVADREKHQLVLVGKVAQYPEGFSAVEFPRIVDKAGNENIPQFPGVSIINDTYDDLGGLL